MFAALLGLIAVGAGVSRLAVSGVIIYRVLTGQASFSALATPLLVIAGLIVVRSLFQYWQNAFSHHTANVVKIALRRRLYAHSLELGPAYFDRNRTGDVTLTMVEGIERLETFFGQYLSQIIVSAVAPVAIFIYMASLDLVIALVFLLFAFLTLAVPAMFHSWNKLSSFRRRESYGELGADFLDSVQGLPTLKAFGQGKIRGAALAERARHLYRSTMGVVAANGATSGASIFFMAAGAAAALALGAARVGSGDMELRPLLIVLMLGVEVFRPMRELTNLYHQGMTVLSSAQSVFGMMDEPASIRDPERPAALSEDAARVRAEVVFEEVSFGYDGGSRPALRDISFELRQGETLGVAGPSGAGKSTLVWLMYRFYDPQRGTVRLGGHDVRDLPIEALRSSISVVTQDTYLFHGSVADNLRFGKPDASRREIEAAARAANAHDFISALPRGYDTVVGERAVRLSGGQRQRVAIARALLKDAPILVLDEALSSVDAENEAAIQQALDRLMEGRTTLVIAHRLSSIVSADRILVLDDGSLAEIGSHSELIAQNGVYSELMRQQTETGAAIPLLLAPDHGHRHIHSVRASEPHLAAGSHDHAPPARSRAADQDADIRSLSVWARLFGLVRPVKFQFLFTLALGILHHSSVIVLGAVSALLVAAVFRGDDLTAPIVLVAVFAPLSALLFFLESWQAHDMAYRLLASMRSDLYDMLEPLAPAYMVRRRSGDLVSVVGGDVETVEYFFAHAISPMIVAVLVPGGLLIALAFVSWPIAAVLLPFLVAVAASPFFANSRAERLGAEIRGRMGDIHAFMVDSIQGMREISAFGRGADRNDDLERRGWEYAAHLVRFQKSQAFQIGFIEAMMGLGGLAVLAMGVWLVLEGQFVRAQLPLVSVLALSAFSPVTELARTMKQLMETLAASRRILAVHDEPVPVRDGPGVQTSPALASAETRAPSIRFRSVSFAYSESDPEALRGVSFHIGSGQTVALVGRSGAGKTTCAYLAMRFWDPGSGRVELGDRPLTDFALEDLRGRISLVAQDTYLFNDSIRENIRLGRHGASDDEVQEAARQANAHEFITSFPDGYDTLVGERGMQLSGGQRQRVSIARAILKNAPVLILDEATSHLDAVSEATVREALDRLMEGRTTLVIAHRLSTVRDADNILALDDGVLVEQGAHEQLIASGGLYAQLTAAQMVAASHDRAPDSP